MKNEKNTLEIAGLNKKFGEKMVLKDVSLSLKNGEILAILGPSGSGKSTLLRCLNALEMPESGSLKLDSLQIDFSAPKARDITALRKRVAMVFQNHNLFANKTALENITEGLVVVQKMPRKAADSLARELLAQVGLSDKQSHYPHELSGGQAQRVGIARAMALHPELILFDEPTSALDVELVGEVLSVIRDFAKSAAHPSMLIVTHELDFARQISQRVAFMSEGEIIECAPTQAFFSSPKSHRAKRFLGNILGDDFCI